MTALKLNGVPKDVLRRRTRQERLLGFGRYDFEDQTSTQIIERLSTLEALRPKSTFVLRIDSDYDYDYCSLEIYIEETREETDEEYAARINQYWDNRSRNLKAAATRRLKKQQEERELYLKLKSKFEGDSL